MTTALLTKQPTILDQVLQHQSRPGTPTRRQMRLAREFDIDIEKLSKAFMKDIIEVLEAYGRDIKKVVLAVLGGEKTDMYFRYKQDDLIDNNIYAVMNKYNLKDAQQDAMDAALIAEAIDTAKVEAAMVEAYILNYRKVVELTGKRLNTSMGLAFITDDTEAQILATATERVKLLKMKDQLSQTVFRQLSEGRADGESVAQLARRLREFIPAGRFKTAQTRAVLIARTEVTHAQKMAAAETYSTNRVQEVMIMDARKGPTDAECESWNGRIVSLQAGLALMNSEHPNGTRRMVAMPPEDVGV